MVYALGSRAQDLGFRAEGGLSLPVIPTCYRPHNTFLLSGVTSTRDPPSKLVSTSFSIFSSL